MMEARTYRREAVAKKVTQEDIIHAIEQMRLIPVSVTYYFHTAWVKPYASEEECIQYFADNGSVIVIDQKGRSWRMGKQI